MIKVFNCDCLKLLGSQDLEILLKGRKAVIVTDPPFNIGYHYDNYNDRLPEEEYYSWLEEVFTCRGGVTFCHYTLSRVYI